MPDKTCRVRSSACVASSSCGDFARSQNQRAVFVSYFQTHPTQQQVVSVSTEQSQSQILLQCRSSGLDLTAPALHSTKLLPQSNAKKEEIFAIPKVLHIT